MAAVASWWAGYELPMGTAAGASGLVFFVDIEPMVDGGASATQLVDTLYQLRSRQVAAPRPLVGALCLGTCT